MLINKQIYSVAQGLLAQREHSKQELSKKLLAKGFDKADVECALDILIRDGLQSDERYVEAYINSRSNKGYGPNDIRQHLAQKGISSSIFEQVCQQLDIDWLERLEYVWQKKYGKYPLEPKEKAKQKKFLYYRGFDAELINQLFNALSVK